MEYDLIKRPEHYIKNGIETIEVIEALTESLKGIEAVCVGNIIKYVARFKEKNGKQDLEKAKWYLEKLITLQNKEMDGKNGSIYVDAANKILERFAEATCRGKEKK